MTEIAEVAILEPKELEVTPKQLAALILDTLEIDSSEKAKQIEALTEGLDPENDFDSEIINSAKRMVGSIDKTVALGRDALAGKPIPIVERSAERSFIYLGDELGPEPSEHQKITEYTFDPNKSTDNAHLVDLLCRTLENSVRQDASPIFGYSQLVERTAESDAVKDKYATLASQSMSLSQDTLAFERMRDASFAGNQINVAARGSVQILSLS